MGLGLLPVLACGGLIILAVLAFVVMIYNRLITLRNRVDNAWAQIDVQLKRRYDLIPNLVETVKGYMKHERETLESVTKYRAQLVTGGAPLPPMLVPLMEKVFSWLPVSCRPSPPLYPRKLSHSLDRSQAMMEG